MKKRVTFNAYKIDGSGVKTDITYSSAKMVDGYLQITFGEDYVYNTGRRNEDGSAEEASSNIFLTTSCGQTSGIPTHYDYSKMGETWSTPRIVRLPNPDSSTLSTTTDEADVRGDRYVAIMGAGMSSNYLCAGSALYLIELSDMKEPGKLFGYKQNKDDPDVLDPIPTELDLLEKARSYTNQYSYREVANWLSTNSGRYISHVGLRKRLNHERKRKNQAASLRKWAEYAEKAISKAKEIEEARTGAKAAG